MPKQKSDHPYGQITTLRTLLYAGGVFVVGVTFLYFAGLEIPFWKNHEGLHALCENAGALLMISVALGVMWELLGKRSFTRELLETAKIGGDIGTAGLRRIGTNFLEEPEWEALFANVRQIDIFAAYAQTWRNSQIDRLHMVAERSHCRIRLILPDPDDDLTIENLAHRFDMTRHELLGKIRDTRVDFEALRVEGGASVDVLYWAGDRLYGLFLFDNTAVVSLYKHRTGRGAAIPMVICQSPGSWYQFFTNELQHIVEHSRSVG